jgi:hypothetical protein
MIVVFPEAEGPNSLDKSTLIVNIVPSTIISTFFIAPPFHSTGFYTSRTSHSEKETLMPPASWATNPLTLLRMPDRLSNRTKDDEVAQNVLQETIELSW